MKFKDKVVVVTGSTRGIGREIAHAFAREGAVAVILGRSAAAAAEVRDELARKGLKAESFGCDVTNPENVLEIVNKILDKYKTIDILVNNAGITKDNLLLRMSENDWDEVMNVNLKGAFNCTKIIAKVMLKAAAKGASPASGGASGKIINISSIIGIMGNAGQANYAASKAGIIGFTKAVARELASRQITVNAVAPGYIQTDMTAQLKEEVRNAILNNVPLGRLGTATDVANVCLFLASPEADYITGQTLCVDGGMAI
ncbi:MAG TPA: 3-oxoacyl-[acyl-carrier-protein] reductase [Candidatus Omnitrophica bacterium]|nr:MAG: 3-oxoacyl-[acyl-carrier-protein] reductase [Omnitrophica WOR_2 bacterium GWA2_53_43]HBO96954.1 3-oxoacyl-[acyl-carrier-protein] reductase [Candidatus Omnitrophota bacterium]HCI45266.1 3-oxoacyl-[acyl-carrier-protein] reductase [Candidatus Omnitrophota bacterium]